MNEPNLAARASDDAEPQPVQDVSCLNCGYSLEGLSDTDLCPECAKPVGDSRHRWALRYAARRHREILNAGLWVVNLGLVLSALSSLLFTAVLFVFPGEPGFQSWAFISRWPPLLVTVGGVWTLTRIDPDAPAFLPLRGARWIARGASVGAALLCAPFVADFLHGFLLAALMHYTHGLALRVPDVHLARWCVRFRWVLPSALALPVVFAVALFGFSYNPSWSHANTLFAIQLVLPAALLLSCVPLQRLQRHVAETLGADAMPKDA